MGRWSSIMYVSQYNPRIPTEGGLRGGVAADVELGCSQTLEGAAPGGEQILLNIKNMAVINPEIMVSNFGVCLRL